MSKAFASQADLQEKKVTFTKLSDNAYAYTAEGDPNTGVVIGDDAVMVIDTQATPVMAEDVIRHIRTVTDKPVKYVVMSHYHAVRVLGASAYGASEIIASEDTRDLIVERGAADMKSEIERFPRLFRAVETIPGLTWPTLTFKGEMTVWLGKLEVKRMLIGRGYSIRDLFASVKSGVAQGHDLKRVFADTDAKLRPTYGSQFIYEHCMPFDVSRAFDEATEHRDPRIWTAERDKAMWASLG